MSGIGQEVPGGAGANVPEVRRPGPLGVRCPKCAAPVGRPCRLPSGAERKTPHPARDRHAADEPITQEPPEEIERRRAMSARKLADVEQTQPEGADR